MAALGRRGRGRQAAAPAPTTATRSRLAAGASSNSVSRQACGLTRQVALPVREDLIEAGLIAGDADVDLVGASPSRRLVDEVRVGQERARHRDQVARRRREHCFGELRRIDAIGCDHRNLDRAFQRRGAKRKAARGTT